MKREILFRGKRLDDGEWVYGSLVCLPGNNEIGYIAVFREDEAGFVLADDIEVNLNTVGQYTGLKDRNGKKIFEGDIIKYTARLDEEVKAEIKFGLYDANDGRYNCGFYADWYGNEMLRQHLAFWTNERDIEVVGNIHDQPAGGTDNE